MPKGQAAPSQLVRLHERGIQSAFFISGDVIISASDSDIRRYLVSNGHNEVLREGAVCAIATSPNGRWIAVGGRDGRVRLIDVEAPKEIFKRSEERHADVISSLSFSPNSDQLASGAKDGTMVVWSWSSQFAALEPVAGPFEGHKDAVWCVCFSPDGGRVASCDREVIQIWELNTRIGVTINEPAWSLAWSSDPDIFFAGCVDGSIKCYDPNVDFRYTSKSHQDHADVVSSIVLSHNGNFIATASWDKTVRFFETVTFQKIGPDLKHPAQVNCISISPDDSSLISATRDPNPILRIWNLRTIVPALFRTLPLEPVRKQPPITVRPHLPTPTNPADDYGRLSPHPSESSVDTNASIKSWFLGRVVTRLSKPKVQVDCSQTPSPSLLASSEEAFPSPASSYHAAENPTNSPTLSVINTPSPTSRRFDENEFWRLVREIREFNLDLRDMIHAESPHPVTGGSHGDIYRGDLHVNGTTVQVAIKAIKRYLAQGDDLSRQRRLRREIKLWMGLDHKNVVPLLGTTTGYGDFPAMVCPWVENGPLSSYLKTHHEVLTAPRRWGIINDVALGLEYLHSQSIVHGDISGTNILVYGSGRACISDFGLSFVTVNVEDSSLALTYQLKGTLCYTAPELFVAWDAASVSEDGIESGHVQRFFPTTQSDIYSFGGIMLQVLSGKRPYHHLANERNVILAMSRNVLPLRPAPPIPVVTDNEWEFLLRCWSSAPRDRPSDIDMVKFVHDELISAVSMSASEEQAVQTRPMRSGTV